jgi:aspartate racemase
VYYVRLVDEASRRLCGERKRFIVYSLVLEEMCRAAKSGDREGVAGLLLEALGALARAGVSVAFIAANTPHIAWDIVEPRARELGLRLVSIVGAGVRELAATGAGRAGVIATSATLRSRLFQDAMRAAGLEAVEPVGEEREALDRVIEHYASGRATQEDYEALLSTARLLVERGAEALLLACTDLGPLRGRLEKDLGVRVVDPAVAQVEEALRLAYPECSMGRGLA